MRLSVIRLPVNNPEASKSMVSLFRVDFVILCFGALGHSFTCFRHPGYRYHYVWHLCFIVVIVPNCQQTTPSMQSRREVSRRATRIRLALRRRASFARLLPLKDVLFTTGLETRKHSPHNLLSNWCRYQLQEARGYAGVLTIQGSVVDSHELQAEVRLGRT